MVIVQMNVSVVMYYKLIGTGTVWLVESNSIQYFVDQCHKYCTDSDIVVDIVVDNVVVVVLVFVDVQLNIQDYSKQNCVQMKSMGRKIEFRIKLKCAQLIWKF